MEVQRIGRIVNAKFSTVIRAGRAAV